MENINKQETTEKNNLEEAKLSPEQMEAVAGGEVRLFTKMMYVCRNCGFMWPMEGDVKVCERCGASNYTTILTYTQEEI